MHGLQQLVETGKVSAKAAERLKHLEAGAFCTHKSWGFGRVRSWDMAMEQVLIDFSGKAGHAMQFQYAAESLTPLEAGHILARKATELEALRREAAEAPAALMRCVVKSLGRSATGTNIEATLCPDVIAAADWKKWWEGARRAMRQDGHFAIPASKSAPIVMRDGPPPTKGVDPGEFESVMGTKAQAAWIAAALKHPGKIEAKRQAYERVVVRAEETLRRTTLSLNADFLQLALCRDELAAALGMSPSADVRTGRLLDLVPDLPAVVDELPSASQGRVLGELVGDDGERVGVWVSRFLSVASARLVGVIREFFAQRGEAQGFRLALQRGLREQSLSAETLLWLLRNRKEADVQGLVEPRMFSTLLAAIERDSTGGRRATRLHDVVVADKRLLIDLLEGADGAQVRDIARAILLTSVFSDMDRRSLLGRLVKAFPDIEKLVSDGMDRARSSAEARSESAKEAASPLIVSWASLEQRKRELDDLVTKKIPANTKDIAVARSYGDLSENAEFKFAKEQQRVLGRRRAELERELLLATGTDFKGADPSRVGIGTIVTVRDGGRSQTFTILGAWDTDPSKGIVSYLTAVAKALSQKAVGDRASIPGDEPGSVREVVIESIGAYNP